MIPVRAVVTFINKQMSIQQRSSRCACLRGCDGQPPQTLCLQHQRTSNKSRTMAATVRISGCNFFMTTDIVWFSRQKFG
jgi:hypothetical protein